MIAVERLKRRPDFLRVARGRRQWVTPGLILQVAQRQSEDEENVDRQSTARVGFTASGKIGGAVVRNRARRRLRAAVAAVFPSHALPAHDYVLIARRTTLSRKFSELVRDLDVGLRRLGLYRAESDDC
jgi:ribonuclease P protein component